MRNPLPTGDRIQAVASGNGQFVAVGDDGTIVTSTDAANWVERQTTTDPLWAIVHDNGEFVAVGWGGTIMTSADGVKWVQRQSEMPR